MRFKRFPLGAIWTNGYLFWDGGGSAFFIDPGGDAGDVLAFLKDNSLNLEKVLLTHGHLDHIAGVKDLQPLVGNNVYVGKNDARLLRQPSEELQRLLGMECEPLTDFQEISEGETISTGTMEALVMETPGHTEGSVCFMIKDDNDSVLVSGDTLFAQSVGRTDLDGGDSEALRASLKRLAELPDDLRVLPGHGPETSIGDERKHNPFWPK